MKSRKGDIKRATVKFSITIVALAVLLGAALSFAMYFVIQKSFFEAMVSHEMELMRIMESMGNKLTDHRLHDLKVETENAARQYAEELSSSTGEGIEAALSAIPLGEYELDYCYQTKEGLYLGQQFSGEYTAQLNLSQVWEGESVIFAPDFDAEGNYILTVAVPVWQNQQEQTVKGILIKQLDGYCLSKWLEDLFTSLDFGTAYLIDSSGRNIATAREENYDWITTRYNAQELVKENTDESTVTVARLEKFALEGKTGMDTYEWEGNTSYVAYGPLTEADWGFFVGFYGAKFENYAQEITSISSRAAGVVLLVFTLFLGAIIAVVMRSLSKERNYSKMLMQQKTEIEQQALHIAASEERFRIAMQRSRDIILEYQFETGEITCFHLNREIKSGRIGDKGLREYLVAGCSMDEDSFERFEEVMRAISKGLTSAECIISGDHGEGRKWYNMSVSAIPNGTQKSTRAVGILQDVTGEREAELDSLTRLLNKAAMISNVRAGVQKNLPETAGAFVMLDVDHFKLVNDKYGHPVGDQVLCTIAEKLRKVFPKPYLIGRFGGDEFSIYCPSNADSRGLKSRLKQLSEEVREMPLEDGGILKITLSMGAVIFRGEAQFEKIYIKADEMLYEVKEAGRDGCRILEEK